jgi:O-antigen/teichoic acid export membrane protein
VTDARLRRDIVWNLVPVVFLGAVGLGLNFLIGGWWGPAALGVFNQVTTAFFVFSVIAAFGIQYSVLRAVAEAPDDREHVARVAVGALVPTAVIATATTALFVALAHPIARWLDSDGVAIGMLWAAPGLICFALNKVLLGIVNGLRRMRAFAIYTSLRYTLIAVGLVVARVASLDPYWLAGIWTFAEGILLLVLVGELVATVALRRCSGWTAAARTHLEYGKRGVLATLAFEANSKLDVWMLGVAMSDKAVGIYSLAAALWEGVMQLGVVLQNNLNPMLARELAAGNKTEVEAIAKRTRRWFVPLFIVGAAIAAAVFPFAVPWLIGNHEFIDGALPFGILLAGASLASAYLPFQMILLMASMPGAQTVYVTLVLATNCTLNLVLVPVIGLAGAAAASATALAVSAVLLRFIVRARIGAKL